VRGVRNSFAAVISLALFAGLSGCRPYADFTLPPPDAAGPGTPFQWQAQPAPVLTRDGATDVLNPTVIRYKDSYLNLYSEYDGRAWHTDLAQSSDGVTWTKRGRVLSPSGWEGSIAANGTALASGDEIFYWYVGGDSPEIGLARSHDGGATWTKEPAPVVPLGPYASFDEKAVADPDVIRRGEYFYLYYLGQDRARRQRLGVARSRDGVRWEKLRSNPVLELGDPGTFDEAGLGEPAVWTSGGSYWMLYTGRDRGERRRLGLARSSDGVKWERESDFIPVAGADSWDKEVICDPSVEVMPDNSVRVWFGGGDVPRPDQNLDGQIGVGILRGR
jgi:predicted GH43/DUF377 family glycosyl hydrolase